MTTPPPSPSPRSFPCDHCHRNAHGSLSGRPDSVTYPKDVASGQPTVRYRYHLDGQLAKIDYVSAAMADVTYNYEASFTGRLTSIVDGQGTTALAYLAVNPSSPAHGAGQLSTINGPWQHDTVAYTYDPLGRPLTRQIRNDSNVVLQTETWAYDALGRLASTVNGLGTHTVAYDGNSSRPLTAVTKRPSQTTAFLTRQFEWQTGAQGARLAKLKNRQGATAATILSDFEYTYSPAGQIETWKRHLGTGSQPGTWEMDYDPTGQLTALEEKNDLNQTVKQWAWGYDAAGNRTHEIEGPAMRLAGIGGANRLDRVGGAGRTLVEGTVDEPSTVTVNGEPAPLRPLPGGSSFLYSKELNLGPGEKRLEVEATDPNGNVARRSYTVSVGGVERTLAHDLNGNVTQEAVAGGKTRVYEWDAINRLTAIQSDATPLSGSWRSEFTYDGQSRRVRIVEKTWNPVSGAWMVESDHRYLWCGTEICQKRNSTGATVVAKYYDQGEQQTVGSTTTDYYYTRDHLGSIREVIKPSTNAAGHEIHLRYDYTAWGERSKLSGGADVEWGFTGHHYHAKSGLHLALYRAYDANLGRWLSEDPLGEAGGVNLYGYADNSPLNAIDPDGAMPLWLANVIDSDAANATADFIGGFSNDWLFGIPEKLGAMDGRDKCSDAYGAGELVSTVTGLLSGGKGGYNGIKRALALGGKKGGLALGLKRMLYDDRAWSTISRQVRSGLGLKGAKSIHLGHMNARRANRSGFRNAGLNVIPMSAKVNSWLGNHRRLEHAFGATFRVGQIRSTLSPFMLTDSTENCNQ